MVYYVGTMKKRLAILMARLRDKDSPSFKEATVNMTKGQKVGYIWEYYRLQIIGGIAGFALVFSLVHAFVTNTEPFLMVTVITGFEHTVNSFGMNEMNEDEEQQDGVAFPNVAPGIWVDFDLGDALEAEFVASSVSDAQRYEIQVQQLGINVETMPVLATHTGAGVLDLMITYAADFEMMTEVGHFAPLSILERELPEHILHSDYGIYLRYLPILENYIYGIDDLIIGISVSSRNIDRVEQFFDVFLPE